MVRSEHLTTFSVAFICSSFALTKTYQQPELLFLQATYVIIALYGILGALNNIKANNQRTLEKWLGKSEVFVDAVGFPCYVTQIWLKYGIIQKYAAWLHVILGAIPAVIFVLDNRLERKWIQVVVYVCSISSCVVCLQQANAAGVAAAVCFFVGYCIQHSNKIIMDRPPETCFNLLTAAFTILSVIAIVGKL